MQQRIYIPSNTIMLASLVFGKKDRTHQDVDVSFVELMSLKSSLLVKIPAYSGPRQRIDSEIYDLSCIFQIGIKIHMRMIN